MEPLSDRIKHLREKAGHSQAGLAKLVGVSRPAVSKWESGDTENIKLANIVRLCKIYSISADDLLSSEMGGSSQRDKYPTGQTRPGVHPVNEAAPVYGSMPARIGPFPAESEQAFSDLTEEGKSLVLIQLTIALDTARKMYGTRHQARKTAT